MSRLVRTGFSLLVICAALFAVPSSVLAIPALPSSFYGTVKLNSANVPDGTLVQAFIGGLVIAQGYTQLFQGDSYYALDVPSDDTATPAIDGGREGDTIAFKVGGITAHETGTWHSGTDVQLKFNRHRCLHTRAAAGNSDRPSNPDCDRRHPAGNQRTNIDPARR